MKQTKFLIARCLTLLILALLSTNLAWGTDVTKTYTLSTSDNGKTVTTDGVKWEVGSNAIEASSSNMKLTGTITVTLPTGATLNKVEITKSSTWGSGATVVFASGTTTLNTFSSNGTFDLTSNKTDGVYTFTKGGTSSKNAWVKEIKVTYKEAAAAVEAPTFTPAAGNYMDAQSVTLSCATDGASIYYTTNGTEPTAKSTLYESAIAVNNSMTIKAIAIKGEEKSIVATAAYKITTYASLEDLVADGDPGKDGYSVTVTLTNEVITDFYTSSSDSKHHGVYLKVGEKTIEIYCNANAVPEEWIEGGTVSGTLQNCTWKNFNGTWELCPTNWESLTYTAPTTYNITIADGIQNGTVKADMEKAAAGVEVTLTVTPDEGYKLGILTVKDATEADVPVEDNKFTMPASDVYVSATFEAIPTHEAKFFVNGVQYGETQNVLEGGEVVFPETDPENIGTKKFVGWTASPMDEVSDEAPEFVKSATMAEEALNFYAVFADATITPEVWNKVTDASTLAAKDVLRLAATASGSKTESYNGTFAAGAFGEKTFFSSVEATITNDKLTSENAIDITLGGESGAWTLTTSEGQITTSEAKVFKLNGTDGQKTCTITIDKDGKATITFGDYGKILYNRESPRFLNYTSNTSASMILPFIFRKSGGKTYSDYCTTITSTNIIISEAGWATVCLPFKATITSGNATAYYVTGTNETALTKEKAEVIPANEGILLKGKEGEKTTVTFTISDEDADPATDNMMKGAIIETTFNESGYKYYILANGGNGLGFYYQGADNDGSTVKCAAGKAVLAVPTTSGAKAFFSLDNEPTGIESITPTFSEGKEVYNLNGMRVNPSTGSGQAYKGIVIMNGKKYINK